MLVYLFPLSPLYVSVCLSVSLCVCLTWNTYGGQRTPFRILFSPSISKCLNLWGHSYYSVSTGQLQWPHVEAPFHRPDANWKPDGSITKDKPSATLPTLQRTESELHRSSESKEEFTLNTQQREGSDRDWHLTFRNGSSSVS